MTQRVNILKELSELGITALNSTPVNVYEVPAGYFDNFPGNLMKHIKSEELKNELPAMLADISKELPYSVAAGYFDGLEERLMQAVRESADYQTAREELQSLSPLLTELKKENTYEVPAGYFENFDAGKSTKPKTKVVSITRRRWLHLAAAAVVTGLAATLAFLLLTQKTTGPVNENKAWAKVEKTIQSLNDKELMEFIEMNDVTLNGNETAGMQPVKKDELLEMLKDVSAREIKEFLEQTAGNGDETLMLN
jgi:hypothetical protein